LVLGSRPVATVSANKAPVETVQQDIKTKNLKGRNDIAFFASISNGKSGFGTLTMRASDAYSCTTSDGSSSSVTADSAP